MLKITWIPSDFRNVRLNQLQDKLEKSLANLEKLQATNERLYANLILMQSEIANLSEEEAKQNVRTVVEYMRNSLNG